MKQKILQLITEYPKGLSRGIDNDIKLKLYYKTIPEMFDGKMIRVQSDRASWAGGFDHFCEFTDFKHIYVYSQPYHQTNSTPVDYGWELFIHIDDSWYFPKGSDSTRPEMKAVTDVYRKPVSEFSLWTKDNMLIALPSSYEDWDVFGGRTRGLKPHII